MTNPPNPITSLQDLTQRANDAATQLGQASRGNAIWDKASKSLSQGLAPLDKARADAEEAIKVASEVSKDLAGQYDSPASEFVRDKRTDVDTAIKEAEEAVTAAETALTGAKSAVAAAQAALDQSNANFEAVQKKLLGLPKMLQDGQKELVALQKEVTDAHNKHLLVDAVVKLADLDEKIKTLQKSTKPEEAAPLWQDLSTAADDLLKKTEALPPLQAQVPIKEAELNAAKVKYAEAVKNRLDTIRNKVADQQATPDAMPA